MRLVIPAEFIRLPARMKNGTASSGKLSRPPAMRCRMTKSGMPAMKWVWSSEENASAMNTGMPASKVAKKTKIRIGIVQPSIRVNLFDDFRRPAPALTSIAPDHLDLPRQHHEAAEADDGVDDAHRQFEHR